MTLHEAILTGKRFKRENDPCWYKLMEGTQCYFFSRADILATDWEVEEKKVTLTKESLLKALKRASESGRMFPLSLMKELGLEE